MMSRKYTILLLSYLFLKQIKILKKGQIDKKLPFYAVFIEIISY